MQQRCLPRVVFCACFSADRIMIISPQGIAMPEGLYFTLVVLLTPNLWGYWTNLNQTWTHIHLWLLFDKFASNFSGHLPPRAGRQKTILGTDFELWPNISLQQNMISTIGKKLINLQGLPYMPPNLVNFGPETAENDWQVFAHPLNFCIWRHCQHYLMDVI